MADPQVCCRYSLGFVASLSIIRRDLKNYHDSLAIQMSEAMTYRHVDTTIGSEGDSPAHRLEAHVRAVLACRSAIWRTVT